MSKKMQGVRYDSPITIEADDGTVLATCTFAPQVNKVPLDEIPADLVMLAKSQGVKLPQALHLREPNAAHAIRGALLEDFSAACGETKLCQLSSGRSRREPSRGVVLVGLGPSHAFCDSVVCAAFEAFFNQAIAEGARTVVVPFVVNPQAEFCLTHKATAYRLKSVLKRVAAKRGGLGRLQEIKIYCHPSAVKSIRQGLSIAQTGCGCKDNRCARVEQGSDLAPVRVCSK